MEDTLWRLAELLDVEPPYLDAVAESHKRATEAGMDLPRWILDRSCGLAVDLAAYLQDLDKTAQEAAKIADVEGDFWPWWRQARERLTAIENDAVSTG